MSTGAEPDAAPLILHATTIAHHGHAAVIIGPSGAGKSSLALQLIALGAALVADDRTALTRAGSHLIAHGVPHIGNRIEARGVGILSTTATTATRVKLIVDLAQMETDRLPPECRASLLGVSLPLVRKSDTPHFPAAILLYLKGERIA